MSNIGIPLLTPLLCQWFYRPSPISNFNLPPSLVASDSALLKYTVKANQVYIYNCYQNTIPPPPSYFSCSFWYILFNFNEYSITICCSFQRKKTLWPIELQSASMLHGYICTIYYCIFTVCSKVLCKFLAKINIPSVRV